MSLSADLRILLQLIKPARGNTHAARMEAFYRNQADGYDDFRNRLLPGRSELFADVASALGIAHSSRESILAPDSQEKPVWLDLGGGTGANIECIEMFLPRLRSVHIVDLSPSLLHIARQRIEARGWKNVHTLQADVTTFAPPVERVDVVTFSYSMTMIPDWLAAIDQAISMLRPGGLIGVVDFFVSHKHPPMGTTRHGWWTRTFWPTWFAVDNVFLGPDRLAALHARFDPIECSMKTARVPYVPLGRVPYFRFIGKKR